MKMIDSSDNNPKYYEDIQINHIKINTTHRDTTDVFFARFNDIFLLGFSSIIIEESVRQLKYGTDIFELNPIKKLDQNLPKYSDLNILVKTQFLEKIIGHKYIFLNSDTWSWFDVELEKTNILFNGVTNRGNITYLKNSEYSDTEKSSIENILPRHTTGFYKYQIRNSSDLNEVINIISDGVYKNISHLSQNIWFPTEINIAHDDNSFAEKSYIICKAENKNEALKYLRKEYDHIKNYQYLDYDITQIKNQHKQENNWLNTLLFNWERIYYMPIEDYIVFSNSSKRIKSLINNTISQQTIGKNKSLKIINNQLGIKSHTEFYLDFQNPSEDWKKIFNSIVSKNIASKDYFFNSIILLHESQEFKNATAWTFNLNAETNYKPQLVLNHYNKELEVLSQDIENTLYLINNKSELLWKKNIGNAIIGDVHQIDSYNNKKLQYLFNTKDSIYLIDRNGKYVAPFPIVSTQPMSVPLAVFDYDNAKNYRILVAMGDELKMYTQKGKIVSGWEFLKTASKIILTPEHYQIFNKDYVIISEENGITHLLNRKGQARTLLKSKIYRSKKTMNLITGKSILDSKLITTNNQGKVIRIYFDGQIDTLKIQNLTQDDEYIANNEYSIVVKKNQIRFSSNNNRFEYLFETAPRTKPKVFFFNDTTLISIRNSAENLIYLFNEKGQLCNQPFFGTTDFSIGAVNQPNKLNLVVGSQEGLIYNYEIN